MLPLPRGSASHHYARARAIHPRLRKTRKRRHLPFHQYHRAVHRRILYMMCRRISLHAPPRPLLRRRKLLRLHRGLSQCSSSWVGRSRKSTSNRGFPLPACECCSWTNSRTAPDKTTSQRSTSATPRVVFSMSSRIWTRSRRSVCCHSTSNVSVRFCSEISY